MSTGAKLGDEGIMIVSGSVGLVTNGLADSGVGWLNDAVAAFGCVVATETGSGMSMWAGNA